VRALVLNSGSSSIKYELFDAQDLRPLAAGKVEEIGREARLVRERGAPETVDAGDHARAFRAVLAALRESGAPGCVGHRVVHGGARFREPALLDADAIEAIRALSPLAPLHNPGSVLGIEAALRELPDVPQVAVFDTAFHATLPPRASRYAIPRELHDAGMRRYGFHGTSHAYVARRAAELLQRPHS
jgi:acetate kinase